MNNIVVSLYGFKPEEIISYNGFYKILYNNDIYYFVLVNRSEKELNSMVLLIQELNNAGFYCHSIIYNSLGNLISKYDNKDYVLLKIIDNVQNIDIYKLIEYQNKLLTKSQKANNWAIMWAKKIDYMEEQIRLLGKEKLSLVNSFSYYDGLAENAIMYYQQTIKTCPFDTKICLSHRRIFYPNIWLNYGNPLSFIFDIQERDIAEYLKYTFFYGSEKEAYEDFLDYIRIKKMSKYSLQMLLSRLMFPSYYFDLFEDIILGVKSESDLIVILDKTNKYEEFLLFCYEKIQSMYSIDIIPSWLIINQH